MRRVEPLDGPLDARSYVVCEKPLWQLLEEVAAGQWASMVIAPVDARVILMRVQGKEKDDGQEAQHGKPQEDAHQEESEA